MLEIIIIIIIHEFRLTWRKVVKLQGHAAEKNKSRGVSWAQRTPEEFRLQPTSEELQRCGYYRYRRYLTRQLSCRKEDRAMRPIHGCPQNFWVLTTHPATYPEICNGLLFRSILRVCAQNLKFVALPVPEIIGGTQKIWGVPGFAHAPYSPKFLKGFCSHWPCEYICQLWSS